MTLGNQLITLGNHLEGNHKKDSVRSNIRLTPSSGSLSYTTSDTITISISDNLPVIQRNLVYSSWYFNGMQGSFPTGTFLRNLQKLPAGVTQSMTIHNPTSLHAGTYEVLLQLNPLNYLQQFGCSNEYANFITQSSRAGVSRVAVDQVAFDLNYYGK